MKSPLSLLTLSICFTLMFSCGKTDSVEPTADNTLLKTDCLTETSEVGYKDQSVLNTNGFVQINRYYTADGKFKENRYSVLMYDPKTGIRLDLKNAFFNNKAFQAAANGQFQLTDTEENKNANWRFTLPDGTALEICTSQFPKVLNLSAIAKPTAGKDWQFDIDISANKADFVDVSDNKFCSFGNLEGLGNVSTNKMVEKSSISFIRKYETSFSDRNIGNIQFLMS